MRILLSLFLSLLTISPAFAADSDATVSRKVLRIQNRPCYQTRGLQRAICVMELGRGTIIQIDDSGAVGRRLQALQEGKETQKSVLIPKWMTTPRSVDLRSSVEQLNDPARSRRIVPQGGGNVVKEEEEETFPLLRRRTIPGRRTDALNLPVCYGRHGMLLLTCLNGFGIEITPETVDVETWEIYLNMQAESE